MQLILLSKVPNLGRLGDKVNVKPGFGRNYLVPQGKAVPCTAANIAEFEQRRAEYEEKAKQGMAEASSRLVGFADAMVTIRANASSEGKLYGSVGPREIAEALTAAGMATDRTEVIMGEGAIRHTGEFDVQIELHADVQAPVKVIVVPGG